MSKITIEKNCHFGYMNHFCHVSVLFDGMELPEKSVQVLTAVTMKRIERSLNASSIDVPMGKRRKTV